MNKKIGALLSLIALFSCISLVSAFNGFGGYYGGVGDLLENEWIVFSVILVVIFSVLFYSLSRVFTRRREDPAFPWRVIEEKHTGIAFIISLGFAIFIAAALTEQAMLYNILGDNLIKWIMIIVIIAAILIGIIAAVKRAGFTALWLTLIGVWIILSFIDPWDVLPTAILGSGFDEVYNTLTGPLVLIILIILFLLSLFFGRERSEGGGRGFRLRGVGGIIKIIIILALLVVGWYGLGPLGIGLALGVVLLWWLLRSGRAAVGPTVGEAAGAAGRGISRMTGGDLRAEERARKREIKQRAKSMKEARRKRKYREKIEAKRQAKMAARRERRNNRNQPAPAGEDQPFRGRAGTYQ